MRWNWLQSLPDLTVLLSHYTGLFGIYGGLLLMLDRLSRRSLPAAHYRALTRWTWRPERLRHLEIQCSLRPLASDEDADWFSTRLPLAVEQKRTAASTISKHSFDFLGTGPNYWGNPIDWHRDVKSDYCWTLQFYAGYKADLNPGAGADVKIPWELSRCHQLVVLAQAWYLTREEQFAAECFAQWESWLAANPWGYGIHWTSTMEVAIRAVNWLWAFGLLAGAPGWSPERRTRLAQSLWQHGTHIEHNLEVGMHNGQVMVANHYLANVCGLACLGLMCPELPDAKRWWQAGHRALEREVQRQVLSDGFFFESSTSYHRLAIELFLVPALLARRAGKAMSAEYWKRLERMLEVILYITGPDGSVPQIGDNDDGRLLILNGYPDWPRHDHRYLLALGAVIFQRDDFKAAAGGCVEELFWLLGREALEKFDALGTESSSPSSRDFPAGGLYVIRSQDGKDYALIRAGSPTPHAPTAHAHNDLLSLELWMGGQPVCIDPGTCCYTSDLEERDRFRSTAMHNTVMVDGQEINPILLNEPFHLEWSAQVQVLEWHAGENEVRLVAEHDGYRHLHASPRHRRTVSFDPKSRAWRIRDSVITSPKETVAFAARFHSPTPVQITPDTDTSFAAVIGSVKLEGRANAQLTISVEESKYAIQYGKAVRMYTLSVICNSTSGLSITIRE
ncbi:heparinase II/III family protein [Acidobacteria bacterium AH-259-A15]|nr:heparinase II/III family protein [Acidobacteria bacterium AH-259-A15]